MGYYFNQDMKSLNDFQPESNSILKVKWTDPVCTTYTFSIYVYTIAITGPGAIQNSLLTFQIR